MLACDHLPTNGAFPGHASTAIRYRTWDPAHPAALRILDSAGRLVREWPVAGSGELRWDGRTSAGRETPAGIYFIDLAGRGRTNATRIVRIR